ncbi:unnamed protein product [Spirodela intermedia]|uniref:Uncharacterized protein n=1 Tax=Spirodela intermedia TaxID=51605 RepID=A0A7I8JVE2_SPIIN|nr:unnamed protein product [Spirodela intermedia]
MELGGWEDGRGRKRGGRGTERPGPWPPVIEPFVPRNTDLNPRELKSWARRTGFNPNLSGETSLSSLSEREVHERNGEPLREAFLLDSARRSPAAAMPAPPRPGKEIKPMLGRGAEMGPLPGRGKGFRRGGGDDAETQELAGEIWRPDRRIGAEPVVGLREEGRGLPPKPEMASQVDASQNNGNRVLLNGGSRSPENTENNKAEPGKPPMDEENGGVFSDYEELGGPPPTRPPQGLKRGLTENPGFPSLAIYGLQHYLSLAGSLVFIPLILVPAMGGTDEQTAAVISTMLLVSGLTTILHSFFGTRLPLVQGSSFVYLAPALVIANSEEFRNLSQNKFKHIMRELQGGIIVGSLCQTILGYSGLMSLLLRCINPVVVAPTVAAVGLGYFSYGFPQAGNCVEISIPQVLLVLIFTLYLRKVSVRGHRVFLVFAVPLSVAIVWAYAFFLTAGGAYHHDGCNPGVPTSNILLDSCRNQALAMRSCRTDVSGALHAAAWVRVPYPLQWGMPSFSFKTSFIMFFVALVASVDSVGSYHAASVLIGSSPLTPGIVSRGIGLEGCSSILAGLWGTGTGSTTLTENIHTIDATRMASRRALEVGAVFLILFSFVGKVGALLASIPPALAAAALCFTWALIAALGLSTLRYTQAASSRNMIIVGFTLFISLSVPSYLQQYQPISRLILPGYLLPYAAASNGPVRLGSHSLSYALNGVLSLNAVVALLVAFLLDNTVPGSRQERGVYVWLDRAALPPLQVGDQRRSSLSEYALPPSIAKLFSWVKWVGS